MELTADPQLAVAHLGPDILGEPFDLQHVLNRARQSSRPTIGELLLDQRVCAGIGNIYKCESLWLHRVDPWKLPLEIDDDTLRRLYLTARDLMRRNLMTPIRAQRHVVHAHGGRPCPRCGSPIQVKAQGEQARLTYFCPRCQTATVSLINRRALRSFP
jgi:endonuclease-8